MMEDITTRKPVHLHSLGFHFCEFGWDVLAIILIGIFMFLGLFTAPVDGRYLLSAVLTAQTGEQVEASLLVANRNIQKLYTAGVGGGAGEGCVCGGSASLSLALNLKRGQRAGLVLTSGKLAISASSEILSSFSGVLLYPTVAKR